jgi:hypothetical protein
MFVKIISEIIIAILKTKFGEKILKYIYQKYQAEIDTFLVANVSNSNVERLSASSSYWGYLMRMYRGLM